MMFSTRFATVLLISSLLAAWPASRALAADEVMYVTDTFEVTMRSGTSTANSIIRMLKSGEAVTVVEQDLASQYSLVLSADGKQGYVLSRYLTAEPAAREQLAGMRQSLQERGERIAALQDEIAQLQQALEREQADNQTLGASLRTTEQQLAEVRDATRDSLEIIEQNKRLQNLLDDLSAEKAALSAANAELGDTTRQDWFMRGAAVSLIAFLIGILVTRIRWRKKDSWGSY
jgi:SH3 domain protein